MEIIVGDSFEILPDIEDNSYHAIITDPPYNFTHKQKQFLHKQFLRICNGIIIVFSPPENQWILPADHYGFWIKPISTKNTSKRMSRFVEMLFFYGSNVWNTNRHWSQYTNVFMDLVDDTSEHKYRKPPSLIERLVRIHTDEGHRILDPFAGSCVVGEVSIRLNRIFLGIEKEM